MFYAVCSCQILGSLGKISSVSESSGFQGYSRKGSGNHKMVGSGNNTLSFKDSVIRVCSRRKWTSLENKPDSESTKKMQSLPTYLPAQDTSSLRLQEMSGGGIQVLLKPAEQGSCQHLASSSDPTGEHISNKPMSFMGLHMSFKLLHLIGLGPAQG